MSLVQVFFPSVVTHWCTARRSMLNRDHPDRFVETLTAPAWPASTSSYSSRGCYRLTITSRLKIINNKIQVDPVSSIKILFNNNMRSDHFNPLDQLGYEQWALLFILSSMSPVFFLIDKPASILIPLHIFSLNLIIKKIIYIFLYV